MAEWEQAFEVWLRGQSQLGRLRRASSHAVYRAMWQALSVWCQAQQPAPGVLALDGALLARYLASRHGIAGTASALHPRYERRLLGLVRRVQADHAQRLAQHSPESAATLARQRAPRWQAAAYSAAHELPAHLSEDDCQRLQALLQALPADGRWQTWRDRAGAALQLGAGLTPGEVRAMPLDGVQRLLNRPLALPWQLQVPGSGSTPARAVPIAGWAAEVLARWLQRRADEQLAGPHLLPSTRSGKPWGKVAQFESVRRLLAEAGVADGDGGSFRLRHSYALRQLRAGLAPDVLARQLGVVDPLVLQRYAALLAEQSVHAAPPEPAAHCPTPDLCSDLTANASPRPAPTLNPRFGAGTRAG